MFEGERSVGVSTASSGSRYHGKRGTKDATVEGGGKCNDHDDECCLRTDSKTDTINSSAGMRPAMKSLEGAKRLVRKAGVHELQWVWQHRSDGAQQDRP